MKQDKNNLELGTQASCLQKSQDCRQGKPFVPDMQARCLRSQFSIILPIVSAIMLALTRTRLSFDMLVFVAFIPLFYYFSEIATTKKRELFIHGIIFSTITLLISVHWISMVTIPGFIGMLVLFGAIYGGLFVIIGSVYQTKISFISDRLNVFQRPLTFTMIWLSFDFLTNFTEFSYPWFNIGYGLKNSLPLLQVLEIGGLPLLGLLIFVVNYLFYLGISKGLIEYKREKGRSLVSQFLLNSSCLIAYGILFIWFISGLLRINYIQKRMEYHDLTISMLQGNISQDIKWEDATMDTTFTIYETLSRAAAERDNPDLVVFPESALPVYLYFHREHLIRLIRLVQEIQTPIFTGFLYAESGIKHKGQIDPFLYYNTANIFRPDSFEDENYFKNILVPFGERFPFLHLLPFMWKVDFGQANFERGETAVLYRIDSKKQDIEKSQSEISTTSLGYSFTPLICFEIVFPLHVAKVLKEHNPDFILNITNDAWFGKSIGTHQHAVMTAYRTIETRKSIFRCANTGYSFYTTPEGKIHEKTKLFEMTFITGNLYTYETQTPYRSFGYKIPYFYLTYLAFISISYLITRIIYGKNLLYNNRSR